MSLNLRGTIWGAARWLGHRQPSSELDWAIDEQQGGRWVEFGRYATRSEADAWVTRLVAEGRGDASAFRVALRPIGVDRSRGVAWAVGIGLVACAILAFVLVVVTWH